MMSPPAIATHPGRGGPGQQTPAAARTVVASTDLGYAPLADPLATHADANPAGLAVLVDESGGARPSTTSFAELNALVNRLAHAFTSLGAHAGDRIVWCGPNSLEVIVTIHAARA